MRKYPVGIQTFSEIVQNKYVYVDKTDLTWNLAHYAKYVFLSRPRRFGKSLLTSTLESYFRGEKDLFDGLKIMQYEKEWTEYPVFRIDMSQCKSQKNGNDFQARLMLLLEEYALQYGKNELETTPGGLLSGLIRRAYEQIGKQVVVIIDEYDAPLLEILYEESVLEDMRRVMQEFYLPLKANERYIKFCFITGITKFSQLSIFSTINNLTNVTMNPMFANICGITDDELKTELKVDVERLAELNGLTYDEMQLKLKQYYDGYHFTKLNVDIYNPFSLMNTFLNGELANYWFDSGTPSFLIRQIKYFKTDITSFDNKEVPSVAFDQPTENMKDVLPLLYQSGYLSIKSYNPETNSYTLSIPNQEVRIGYTQGLMSVYAGLNEADVQMGFAAKFWLALKQGDIEQAMKEMQVYLAGIPYIEGFKQKLADAATAEGFYEYTMYLIFSMLNVYVRTQVKCANGRIDMVVWMPDTTYVFEFKTTGKAIDALRQIDEKGYAFPYQTEGRKVVKIGVKFQTDTRIPESWVIA